MVAGRAAQGEQGGLGVDSLNSDSLFILGSVLFVLLFRAVRRGLGDAIDGVKDRQDRGLHRVGRDSVTAHEVTLVFHHHGYFSLSVMTERRGADDELSTREAHAGRSLGGEEGRVDRAVSVLHLLGHLMVTLP